MRQIMYGRAVSTDHDGSTKVLAEGRQIGKIWFRYYIERPDGSVVSAKGKGDAPLPEGRRLVHAHLQVGPDELQVGTLQGISASPPEQFEKADGRVMAMAEILDQIDDFAHEVAGSRATYDLVEVVRKDLGRFKDRTHIPSTVAELPADYTIRQDNEIRVPTEDGKYRVLPGKVWAGHVQYGIRMVSRDDWVECRAAIRLVLHYGYRHYRTRRVVPPQDDLANPTFLK